MIKNLIVFDIDDTLTKSEFQHQTAFVETMKHFNIHDIDQNWETYTHMTDSFILKKNYERNLPNSFSLDFVDEFENQMTEAILELKPVTEIKGASIALKHILSHTDFGVCFATGSFLKPALLKLKQAGIPADHNLVVGSNSHLSREEIVKEAINTAKQFYQVASFNQIISIGDGLWDWQTAKNLELHFLGIGEKNKTDFQSKNILAHITDWTNFSLPKLLKKLQINASRAL